MTAATALDLTVLQARPSCALCGHEAHWLGDHLLEAHGLTAQEYVRLHPDAPTMSEVARTRFEDAAKGSRRSSAPLPADLRVKIFGLDLEVDGLMSDAHCLMTPPAYRFATKGRARKALKRALIAIQSRRHTYITGMPGTGKDAFVGAISGMLRKPAVAVNIIPGKDISPWFYKLSINKDGDYWSYGVIWKLATEGVLGRDGVRRPAIIVITDIDRADPAQAEWLRLLMDSTQGRIVGPEGDVVPVFPGTTVVATANTTGAGDERGRMVSAGCLDASILDRFQRVFRFEYLAWEDEKAIVTEKFPLLAERAPDLLEQVGRACVTLRDSIEKDELYGEFSHRGLCDVLGHAEDIIRMTGRIPSNLAKEAFIAWLDGLPDSDNRLVAKRLIDPHLSGGALDDSYHAEEETEDPDVF
tara:strand:+ start:1387 stop:2628 length:1242 start_codon:yes stop_codon:yes gene_type:complete